MKKLLALVLAACMAFLAPADAVSASTSVPCTLNYLRSSYTAPAWWSVRCNGPDVEVEYHNEYAFFNLVDRISISDVSFRQSVVPDANGMSVFHFNLHSAAFGRRHK